jgi:hypothetical protein
MAVNTPVLVFRLNMYIQAAPPVDIYTFSPSGVTANSPGV